MELDDYNFRFFVMMIVDIFTSEENSHSIKEVFYVARILAISINVITHDDRMESPNGLRSKTYMIIENFEAIISYSQ